MSIQELSNATQIRLPAIKRGLLEKKTQAEIAVTCNVSDKTIFRDIHKWVKTEDFIEWLRTLWLDLYRKVDDELAFKEATRLFMKSITVKQEIKEEITARIQEVHIDVTEDEDQVLSKAARILDRKRRLDKIH